MSNYSNPAMRGKGRLLYIVLGVGWMVLGVVRFVDAAGFTWWGLASVTLGLLFALTPSFGRWVEGRRSRRAGDE